MKDRPSGRSRAQTNTGKCVRQRHRRAAPSDPGKGDWLSPSSLLLRRGKRKGHHEDLTRTRDVRTHHDDPGSALGGPCRRRAESGRHGVSDSREQSGRHHGRPGCQPLVCRRSGQQDRPDHHGRRHHRVPRPHGRQRARRYHGRPGRQPLVHRGQCQTRSAGSPDRRRHHRVPRPTAGSGPYGITAGPDGNLWFTERHRQQDRPDHHRRRRHRVPHPHVQQSAL